MYAKGGPGNSVIENHTHWGMSKDEVKKLMTSQPVEENENILVYDQFQLSNLKCIVGYVFHRDKLVTRRYLFNQNYSDISYYLADNMNLKEALEKILGKATTSREWKTTPYTLGNGKMVEAIRRGDLELSHVWESKHTTVVLHMKGSGDKIIMTLNYIGR